MESKLAGWLRYMRAKESCIFPVYCTAARSHGVIYEKSSSFFLFGVCTVRMLSLHG